ncbi:hypothetical protein [Luxibacter massiliensis]|uniref:hypothetical protein n=1 Tax=Luxibacter massiliensis TaxID=2219695 RepID=UPI000F052320|nr:hypothetical protein [Luxibacter massiliensis]
MQDKKISDVKMVNGVTYGGLIRGVSYSDEFIRFVTEHYEQIVQYIKTKSYVIRNQQVCNIPRFSEVYAVFVVTIGIFLWFIKETRRFDYSIALSDKRQLVMYLKEAGILESDQRNNTRKSREYPKIILGTYI